MHTIEELRERQALPLYLKLAMTKTRIRDWVNEYGEDGVYISFSGGKDSTVLLDIVRNQCGYNIPAVFVDTGLEYPEIREFVKTFDNVTIIKPKMNFKQVIEKYGYPIISKEIAKKIDNCRTADKNGHFDNYARKQFEGRYISKNNKTNAYSIEHYKYLLDAPFLISHKCCNVMKKTPVYDYGKKTGRVPITAQMASESLLRTQNWLLHGCNAFDAKKPISNPMSFWTEQDVLLYINQNNLPICSVYGAIIEDRSGTDEVEGQLTISDIEGFENMGTFDAKPLPLKTTGCSRTGCMFCGFGCHLESSPNRFEKMKITHPKQYEWIMKPWDEGGLGYKEVIDWINEHGNLHIKY